MDGTVSAILLARALVMAFNAKPVIVCPSDSVQAIEKVRRRGGPAYLRRPGHRAGIATEHGRGGLY